MNNKFLAVLLCLVFLMAPVVRAEEDPYAPYVNPPSRGQEPASHLVTSEPVFGRVFGVQGSGAGVNYYVFDLTNRTAGHAAVRSALVPGWGQSFNGEGVKSILFFATTLGLAAGSYLRYQKSEDTYDDYSALGVKDSSIYDDYQDQRAQAVVLGSAALVFYVFGILDARRHAYNPLYSQNSSVNFALSPTEKRISWSQKF